MEITRTRLTSRTMAATPETVVKLGGSLFRRDRPDALLTTLAKLGARHRLAIVPGGGMFADTVRTAARQHDLGDTAAHWMAALAMDQSAHLIAERLRRARLVMSGQGVGAALDAGRIPVIAPFAWLHAADPLPHGWEVTSDSIAAWIAGRLGVRRLVLLKAIEGVRGQSGAIRTAVDRLELTGTELVDAHFPTALPAAVECWILSGRQRERLRELLECGHTTGTRVY